MDWCCEGAAFARWHELADDNADVFGEDRDLRLRIAAPLVPCALLALGACTGDRPARLVASAAVPAYVDASAPLTPIRFDRDAISLNDRCPVRKGKLNLKMPPAYVNGRPIGFC